MAIIMMVLWYISFYNIRHSEIIQIITNRSVLFLSGLSFDDILWSLFLSIFHAQRLFELVC